MLVNLKKRVAQGRQGWLHCQAQSLAGWPASQRKKLKIKAETRGVFLPDFFHEHLDTRWCATMVRVSRIQNVSKVAIT